MECFAVIFVEKCNVQNVIYFVWYIWPVDFYCYYDLICDKVLEIIYVTPRLEGWHVATVVCPWISLSFLEPN